jgi:hypothetical protein
MLVMTAGCDQKARNEELEFQIAVLQAENTRLEDTASRVVTASESYDSCRADAHSAYDDRWNRTCKTLRANDLRARKFCKENGGSSEYCSTVDVRLGKDCSLPSEVADDYALALEQEKRFCMDRLKLGR